MRSLPWAQRRTGPAAESTSRCLVMAWRDTANLLLRRVTDSGPLAQRLMSRPSRVASPRAAKSGAASFTRACKMASARDMTLDVDELLRPAALIHPEGFI